MSQLFHLESDTLHTVFTIAVDAKSGRAALSFKTKVGTVYFVCSPSLKRIATRIAQKPQYVFLFGERYTEKQLLSFDIDWTMVCQDRDE